MTVILLSFLFGGCRLNSKLPAGIRGNLRWMNINLNRALDSLKKKPKPNHDYEAELKKKHPELYKLYAKHERRYQLIQRMNNARAANFIQLGNRLPVANRRQKLVRGGLAVVQNPNQKLIDDGEKKLNESLDQLNDIVKADKIDGEKLKILNVKIQKLRMLLKALKK